MLHCNSYSVLNPYQSLPYTTSIDGYTKFTDFFAISGCDPEITEHQNNAGWSEEYKIFIGYNDLTVGLPGGKEVTVDVHKVYEISCKIEKMGEVDTQIEIEKTVENDEVEDQIFTNFFIEKYFGDVTDPSTRRIIEDIIPLRPNADPNEKIQFKIWSDHPEEYVHLEECVLKQEDENGHSLYEEIFVRDGCIEKDWNDFFDNSPARKDFTANSDWFNMRPLLIGCKSKWHIDCTVASCKRGLKAGNIDAFTKFCSVSSTCSNRSYFDSFINKPTSARRRRRSTEGDSSVAEDHVEAVIQHPCFFVDNEVTKYCVDENDCWTLAECAAAFPSDFPGYKRESDDENLNKIMDKIEAILHEYIQEITPNVNDEKTENAIWMKTIEDQAKKVIVASHSIEEVIEEILASITARNQ